MKTKVLAKIVILGFGGVFLNPSKAQVPKWALSNSGQSSSSVHQIKSISKPSGSKGLNAESPVSICKELSFRISGVREIQTSILIYETEWMLNNAYQELPLSNCYDDILVNCEQYGRLYSWDAAMFACPAGWRLPSLEEWKMMQKSIQTQRGLSFQGKGCQKSRPMGVGLVPGGLRTPMGKDQKIGQYYSYWTSTEQDDAAYRVTMGPNDSSLIEILDQKQMRSSVRCVRNKISGTKK